MSLSGGLIPLGGRAESGRLRSNSLSDEFEGDDDDVTNFDGIFDDMLSNPGQKDTRTSGSDNRWGKSRNISDSLSASESTDSFVSPLKSSPSKQPYPPATGASSAVSTKKRITTAHTSPVSSRVERNDDLNEHSYSSAISMLSEMDASTSAHLPIRATTTPDIAGKHAWNMTAPSPVAGSSKGNESEFESEDSILGSLIGENPRTRRSMQPLRIESKSVNSSMNNSKDFSLTDNVRARDKMFDMDTMSNKLRVSLDEVDDIPMNTVRLDNSSYQGRRTINTLANSFPNTAKTFASSQFDEIAPKQNVSRSNSMKNANGDDSPIGQMDYAKASFGNPATTGSGRASPAFFEPSASNTPMKPASSLPSKSMEISTAPAAEMHKKKDPVEDVDIGFVPSFLDPARKPRSRRGTSLTSSISSEDGKGALNNLDRVLGLDTFGTASKFSRSGDVSESDSRPNSASLNFLSTPMPAINNTPISSSDREESTARLSMNLKYSTPNIGSDSGMTDAVPKITPVSANQSASAHLSHSNSLGNSSDTLSKSLATSNSTGIHKVTFDIQSTSKTSDTNSTSSNNISNSYTNRSRLDVSPSMTLSASTSPKYTKAVAPPSSPEDYRGKKISPTHQQQYFNPSLTSSSSQSSGTVVSPSRLGQLGASTISGNNSIGGGHSPTNSNSQSSHNVPILSKPVIPSMDYSTTPAGANKLPERRDVIFTPEVHVYEPKSGPTVSNMMDTSSVRMDKQSTVMATYERDLNNVRQQLEESRNEKDKLHRKYQDDMDALRQRVAELSSSIISGTQRPDMSGIEHTQLLNQIGDYKKERDDLKDRIRILEHENARLRDEAILRESKHREEILYIESKHETDTNERKRRTEEELRMMEQRQLSAIEALKNMHKEEIQSIKDRSKDRSIIEQLLTQLSTTTGSIKFIEEQLNARHQGVEAVKEGQIEARERLIKELENQARTRMESVEIEGYKVKGLLMHLEQTSASLQQQLMEDKLRLRQESERCAAFQQSLEQERRLHHERCVSENSLLKSKQKEIEVEYEKLEAAKRAHEEFIAIEAQRIASDKRALKQLATDQANAASLTTKQLKEEEDRLIRLRREISDEMRTLDSKRLGMKQEMESIEKSKNSARIMLQQYNDLKHQHDTQLETISQSSKHLENLTLRLQEQEKDLKFREDLLQRGLLELKNSTRSLHNKQQDIHLLEEAIQRRMVETKGKEERLAEMTIQTFQQERVLQKKQMNTILQTFRDPAEELEIAQNITTGVRSRISNHLETTASSFGHNESRGARSHNPFQNYPERNTSFVNSQKEYDTMGRGSEKDADKITKEKREESTDSISGDTSMSDNWMDDFRLKLAGSKGSQVLQNSYLNAKDMQNIGDAISQLKKDSTRLSSITSNEHPLVQAKKLLAQSKSQLQMFNSF